MHTTPYAGPHAAEDPWAAEQAALDTLDTRTPLDRLAEEVPALTAPQAQGDLMVLPWPPATSTSWRNNELDAAAPLPIAGVEVHPSHWLIPEAGVPAWNVAASGSRIGTLHVPNGACARLAHDDHGDLRIGPGVYALIRQRRHVVEPVTRRVRELPVLD